MLILNLPSSITLLIKIYIAHALDSYIFLTEY